MEVSSKEKRAVRQRFDKWSDINRHKGIYEFYQIAPDIVLRGLKPTWIARLTKYDRELIKKQLSKREKTAMDESICDLVKLVVDNYGQVQIDVLQREAESVAAQLE